MHGAYLAINPEMEEMRDTIVLTCLLAEQKLRAATAEPGIPILFFAMTPF